jgi:hypothetical protein
MKDLSITYGKTHFVIYEYDHSVEPRRLSKIEHDGIHYGYALKLFKYRIASLTWKPYR